MTAAAAIPAAPKKRGPNTPEGKARSSMNALKHGLRARNFGILPEESHAEWAEHVADLRRGYDPVDDVEEKLVTAIAVAMGHEIRADRTLVETMVEIPPCGPGRSHGTDMADPTHARSMSTAIRYLTAAGMASQRAQRAFFQHRKAKRDGLLLPVEEVAKSGANQNDTNEFLAGAHANVSTMPAVAQACTNEFPSPFRLASTLEPIGHLRAQLARMPPDAGVVPADERLLPTGRIELLDALGRLRTPMVSQALE